MINNSFPSKSISISYFERIKSVQLSILNIIILSFIFLSCTFHMRTKTEVKAHFNFLIKSNKGFTSRLISEKNKLALELSDSLDATNKLTINHNFIFDNKGKQINYSFKSSCYDCFSLSLNNELKLKGYKWTKQNDSIYLSRKRLNRVMLISKSEKSFEIKKLTE